MSRTRSIPQIAAGLVALAVPSIFLLAILFGVLVFLFRFGEKHLSPESYWTKEVDKVESKIQRKSEELKVCREAVVKGHAQLAALYGDLVRQGRQSHQALELVLAQHRGLDTSCHPHIAALLVQANELAAAKAELARHQRE